MTDRLTPALLRDLADVWKRGYDYPNLTVAEFFREEAARREAEAKPVHDARTINEAGTISQETWNRIGEGPGSTAAPKPLERVNLAAVPYGCEYPLCQCPPKPHSHRKEATVAELNIYAPGVLCAVGPDGCVRPIGYTEDDVRRLVEYARTKAGAWADVTPALDPFRSLLDGGDRAKA